MIIVFLRCMQRRGHSLGTFGHLRRPSGILGNHRKHSVNTRQLSETIGNLHFDRFFTRVRHQIGQIWSYRGIHTTDGKLSARSIDSEGGQRLVFDTLWGEISFSFTLGRIVKEKNMFSSRNRAGRGFTSSRLVGITA